MRLPGNRRSRNIPNNSASRPRSNARSGSGAGTRRRLRGQVSRLSESIREQRSSSNIEQSFISGYHDLNQTNREIEEEGFPVPDLGYEEVDQINREIEEEGFPVPDLGYEEVDQINREIEEEGFPVPDLLPRKIRTEGKELAEFIDKNKESGFYDVDGDGKTSVGTDVNLITLYSLGIRGDRLKPFIAGDASIEEVENNLKRSYDAGAFDVDNDGWSSYNDAIVILARIAGLPSAALEGFVGERTAAGSMERFIDDHKLAGFYDIDGDGKSDPDTDGQLIVNYLKGRRGTELEAFIRGDTSLEEVERNLERAMLFGAFDVDNDGVPSYKDGLTIALRLAGFSGDQLLNR